MELCWIHAVHLRNDFSIREMERSSGWLPWLSPGILKLDLSLKTTSAVFLMTFPFQRSHYKFDENFILLSLLSPPPPPTTTSSTWHDGNINYPFDLICDFKRNCYRNGPMSYNVSHGTQCCTVLATPSPIRCQVICSHSGGLGKTVNPLTAGNTWVCTQHCGYWCPGAKAPGHQYPQCWLNINCFGEVSYRNITVKGNYIRKWNYIWKKNPSQLFKG